MFESLETITFIVGLPGSGKTHLGHTLARAEPHTQFIDDILTECSTFTLLAAKLKVDTRHLVLADSELCLGQLRQATKKAIFLKMPHVKINWIFFRNNPNACEYNLFTQPGAKGQDLGKVQSYSLMYTIPSNEIGAIVKPVFQATPAKVQG